ncbi:MAG: hypothetical protein HY898_19245 [Deltaproteobacteria bacterium]|nr:hypothetical protein [Deltaproteobacteria bacterium]
MLPGLRVAWITTCLVAAPALAGCSLNSHGDADEVVALDGSPDDLSVVDVSAEPKPDVSKEAAVDAVVDKATDPALDLPTDTVHEPPDDVITCFPGTKPCGADCVKLDDPATGCGSDGCDPCPISNATAACKNESCVIGSCNTDYADCNGQDVDGCEEYLGSLQSCGACYKACGVANGAAACVNKACTVSSCLAGFEDCNKNVADGCEASLKSAQNCGACGVPCIGTGSETKTCATGQCKVSSCPAGWEDCNQQASDGCEVNLNTVQNCGACGAVCALPHAQTTCTSGACTFASCDSGYASCDGSTANGCEVDVVHDPANCGGCGAACSANHATLAVCNGGSCTSNCQVGWGDCNGPSPPATSDGCESHLTVDLANCGACGRACSTTNASSTTCQASTCVPVCNSGFENCNKPAAPAADDGCESSTANPSIYNCGGCGISCGTNHVASGLCQSGQCVLTCNAGWGDCDKTAPAPGGNNGCEMNVSNNVDNCGACGRACSSTKVLWRSCSNGKCNSPCDWGYGNFNQPAAPAADDGCEYKF